MLLIGYHGMCNGTIYNWNEDMYYYLNPYHLTRVHIYGSAHACAWWGWWGNWTWTMGMGWNCHPY